MDLAENTTTRTRALVLIHSPLTGPGTWRPLAPLCEARGHQVIVPDLRQALHEAPPLYFRLGRSIMERIATIPGGDEIALVVHSGAGALVPMLTRSNKRVRRAVFVDAILPHPGKRWFDTAPTALAQQLRSLAKGGRLQRWHRWWPRGSLEAMVPDADSRARFVAELHEAPLAYLEEVAPLGDVPESVACAYLQLSAAYERDANEAQRRGWPVRRLDLNHLAMLSHAAEVEGALTKLLT